MIIRQLKFTFFLILIINFAYSQEYKTVIGKIVDSETKQEIPFTSIYLPEIGKVSYCSSNGNFKLKIPNNKNYIINFSCIGYKTNTTKIFSLIDKEFIMLEPQSLQLDEVVINAQYSDNLGSKAKITQSTIEYINPTSIKDIFSLLPGGAISSNNIYKRSLITSRQAGSDFSSSLGMGLSIDGVPMHNDGLRVQMNLYTGNSFIDKNIAVNAGVDLRNLATDHIESVTVNNGIASAKEGNLSSGLIQVNSKKGKSPFRVRSKYDPLNKLFYIGKGFLISKKLGTIHTGIDITESTNDIRNTRNAYNRISTQINYNNQFLIGSKKINLNIKNTSISSFNNLKKDEEITALKEKYTTYYKRYTLSTKLDIELLNNSFLNDIEFNASLDYSEDILAHKKNVNLISVRAMQYFKKEGEHEGFYLPQSYFTNYKIENRPFNGFTSLNLKKHGTFLSNLNYNILLGTTLNYTKNLGLGVVSNSLRPPFPDDTYIRTRPNNIIPSLVNYSGYLEGKCNYKFKRSTLNSSIGFRITKMLNLPKDYKLNNLFLTEPRLQIAYQFKRKISEHYLKNNFRIGYGLGNKLPTLDYLYPDKIYRDFMVLNAYFTEPSKRLLITNTKIFNPTNKSIRENRNEKFEVGYDVSYKKWKFSLSVFKEQMDGGIQYFSEYSPVSYRYYDKLKNNINRKPTKDDYESYIRNEFAINKTPKNSSKVVKKGVEYRLSIPKIKAINSKIEINGAYFNTLYTNGIPVMYHPALILNGKPYPYVGYYKGFEKVYRKRLNSSIWIHTHIPKFKLIFTNFVQLNWIESHRIGSDVSVYPSKYINFNGDIVKVTPNQIENSLELNKLKRELSSVRFNEVSKPFSMLMNSKVTKELGKSVRLAFFMNNILQFSPSYNSKIGTKFRNIRDPFFGMELILKL